MSDIPPQDEMTETQTHDSGDFTPFPEEHHPPNPSLPSRFAEFPKDRQPPGSPYPPRPRNRGGCLLGVLGISVVALSLVILALFLPPLSLWEDIDEALNDGDDAAALEPIPLDADTPRAEADGLTIEVTPDDPGENYRVYITALPFADYQAGNTPTEGWHCRANPLPALPGPVASRVYSLSQSGSPPAQMTLRVSALPDTGADALALYSWDATDAVWRFLPARPGASPDTLVAQVTQLPRCVALFRNKDSARQVGVTLTSSQILTLDGLAAGALRVYVGDFRLLPDGSFNAVLPANFEPDDGYEVLPLLQNFDDPAVINLGALRVILQDPALRENHLKKILFPVLPDDSPYNGTVLDYRAIPPDLRASYARFVQDLAGPLHGQQRTLAVLLPAPMCSAGTCDSGGYDWAALGRAADEIVITMPLDPLAYLPGGQAEQIVRWAVTQVDRDKLRLGLTALSIEDQGGGVLSAVPLDEALRYLNEAQVQLDPPEVADPGQPITAQLVHPSGVVIQFGREESVQASYVRYLDADGTVLRTMWITDPTTLHQRMQLAAQFNLGGVVVSDLMPRQGQTAAHVVPGLDEALIAYQVGKQAPGLEPFPLELTWHVDDGGPALPPKPGEPDQPVQLLRAQEGQPQITVEAQFNGQPLASATVAVNSPEPTPVPATATPQPTTPPAGDTGGDDAAATAEPAGDTASDEPPPPLGTLEVPVVDPAILATADTGDELAIGAYVTRLSRDTSRNLIETNFGWRQITIDYTPGLDPAEQQRAIDETHASNFKVLFTVRGSVEDLRASDDPAAYVEDYAIYVGQLALNGADGIEIWPEANRAQSWPLDDTFGPSGYKYLLAQSYYTIKVARPSALVITGALHPLEMDEAEQSADAWDDDAFATALYVAGAADYADCLGVQYVQGTVPPTATSGDPRGDSAIYYLRDMTTRARDAFGSTLPVCYTRLGYLSPESFGGVPDEVAWAADTTVAQQAEWLAGAVNYAQQQADIRLVIVYKLDIASFDEPVTSAGYAIMRPDTTCPACEALKPLLGAEDDE